MDDQRVGSVFRAIRIRRGLRQVDVAIAAGVSDQTVSRIERGHLETLSVKILRRVARVLEVRLDLAPWSRRGDVHRFATADHADLVEQVIRELESLGWTARTEVSFSAYGERGFIDVLAWHAPSRTLLVIEIKTEIVDVGEILGTLDRKRRLAEGVGRQLGWQPLIVSSALIIRESRTSRRRVEAHLATFRTALPDGGRRLRAYLRRPSGSVAALAFWSYRHPGSVSQLSRPLRRVRRRGVPRSHAA
jgi:transcriptional regulator with XRE-family HTH domain